MSNGLLVDSALVTVLTDQNISSIEDEDFINKINSTHTFQINQNYPNPFNPSTTISYLIPKSSFVELKVFNLLGQEVATLVNEEKAVGNYEVNFNASNLPSGVYFYQLKAGDFIQTKKMILLK